MILRRLLPLSGLVFVLVVVVAVVAIGGDTPSSGDAAQSMFDFYDEQSVRQGIAAFCVCIDHAAHDHLRRVCPPARYMVIDEVDALPEQLAKVYRRLVSGP